MAYSISQREKVIDLRKRGYSLNEINENIGIPKGTVSRWVRDLILSSRAKQRLNRRIKNNQLQSARRAREKINAVLNKYLLESQEKIKAIKLNKDSARVLCALLYWCEGVKDIYSSVRFTNADPNLIKTFLKLFREAFSVNPEKFRICVHLHEYHNPKKQIKYWSKITNIPESQFIKPFKKKNTGKRIRKDYNGCISLRYNDTEIARQLLMCAKGFFTVVNKGV